MSRHVHADGQYRAIFEGSQDGLFLWDERLRIVDVNPAGLALYGYAREQGAETIVVRLFNTVGPRQTGAYGMVVPTLIHPGAPDCLHCPRLRYDISQIHLVRAANPS